MKKILLGSLFAFLSITGCANQQIKHPTWSAQYSAETQTTLNAWVLGELNDQNLTLEDLANDPEKTLIAAESAALRFENKLAMERYVYFIQNWPDHALVSAAIIRLEQIISDSYESVPFDQILNLEVPPTFARAHLAKLHQRVVLNARAQAAAIKGSSVSKPLTQFSWVGPFTPFAISEADAPIPPDRDKVLANSYVTSDTTLNAFSYKTKDRTHLGAPQLGLYVGETGIDLAQNMNVLLITSSNNGYAVFVDGHEVTPYETRQLHWNDLHAVRLNLAAGHHNIRVRLAKSINNTNEPFNIWISPESNALEKTSLASLLSGIKESTPAEQTATSQKLDEIVPAYKALNVDDVAPDALGSWGYNVMAISAHDMKSADAMIKARQRIASNDVQNVLQNAHRMNEDNEFDPSNRVDSAIASLESVNTSAPKLIAPRLELASLLLKKHYTQQAFDLVSEFQNELPQNADSELFLSKLYTAKEWHDDARDALNRAYALQPNSCTLTFKYIESQNLKHNMPARGTLSSAMQHCPKVASFYASEGLGDKVILSELENRYPDNMTYKLHRIIEEIPSAPDASFDELIALLDRANNGAHALPGMDQLLPLIDSFKASGHEDYAEKLALKLADVMPGDAEPYLISWFLTNQKPFENLRKNGLEVIKNYAQSAPVSDASSIIVLDYAATRFFENGASVTLTHQITRVTDKDGLNASGEIYIPKNAAVLNLRTIKQDTYAIIEPETIGFKQSVTAPNLSVGDYIDVEYVTFQKPMIPSSPATALDMRFYYGMLQTPLVHSEFVIEYPSAWQMNAIQHSTANFTLVPNCQTKNDYTRCTTLLKDIPPFIPEPSQVPLDDVLPNIQYYSNYSWNLIQRRLANLVVQRTRITPYVEDYLKSMNVPDGTIRERANYIYNYVIKDIDESENDDYLATTATNTVTRKSGSRMPLLVALYNAAGITANVALLQGITAPEDMTIPSQDFMNYYLPAIVVETETGPAYVQTFEDSVPFDYIQPEVQGRDVILAQPDAPITKSRTEDFSKMESIVNITFDMDDVGGAVAAASETLQSDRSIMMRYVVSRAKDDPEQLNRIIERSLARSYGRITLNNFDYDKLDALDTPFEIQYNFEAGNFSNASENTIKVNNNIFSYNITASYAPYPVRKTTLVIGNATSATRNLTFKAPSGYHFNTSSLTDVSLHTDFGNFTRQYILTDDGLTVHETLDLRPQKITPEDYAQFRAFCNAIDVAQSNAILLEK